MRRDYDFSASEPQFETRLKKWDFRKYATKDEWIAIHHAVDIRRSQGKESADYLHGVLLPKGKIEKERKRQRNDGVLRGKTRSLIQRLPRSIRVQTPTVDGDFTNVDQQAVTPHSSRPNVDVGDQVALNASMRTPNLYHALSWCQSPEAERHEIDDPLTVEAPTLSYQELLYPENPLGMHVQSRIESQVPIMDEPLIRYPLSMDIEPDVELEFTRPGRPYLEGHWTRPRTYSLLHCLEKQILSIPPGILGGLHGSIDLGSLPLHALCPPNTKQILETRNPNVRIVYMVLCSLVNDGVRLEKLTNHGGPMEEMLRRVVRYFNGLNPRHFAQFLENFPKPFSQALEHSIFCAAVELGMLHVVENVLNRGIDPNQAVLIVHKQRYTALERSCLHGWVDITRCLLRRNADPHKHLYLPIMQCCFPPESYQATLPTTRVEIFELLLQADAGLVYPDIASIHHFQDPRLYHACLQNIPGANYEVFIKSGFLPDMLRIGQNEVVTPIVISVLGRPWQEDIRETRRFQEILTRSLTESAYRSNMEAFRALLEAGATPDSRSLSMAIKAKNLPAITDILDYGISPTKPDSSLDSELMVPIAEAIRTDSLEVLDLFSQRDLFSTLDGEYTALPHSIVAACKTGNEELLDQLLELWGSCSWVHPDFQSYTGPSIRQSISAAITSGHPDLVPKLLASGILPTRSALTQALWKGHLHIASLLIEGIEDLPDCFVALHLAVLLGSLKTIQDLLAGGVPLESCWEGPFVSTTIKEDRPFGVPGIYPLMTTAILKGDQRVIDLLLDLDAPLEYKPLGNKLHPNDQVVSPLFAAVRTKNFAMVQELIARGVNSYDNSAMLEATKQRDFRTVNCLLEATKSSHPRLIKGFGAEALLNAIVKDDLEMLRLLLPYTDPNHLTPASIQQGTYKVTAFGAAIFHKGAKSVEMINACLEHGADVHGVVRIHFNESGSCWNLNALLQAITTGQLSRVQMIVKAGAKIDPSAKLGSRRTPLQFAVEWGTMEIIHYLLQQGADVNEPPAIGQGSTALQIAAKKGYIGIASLLIERGADVNAAPGLLLGRTAFEGAAEHGRLEMLPFLAENGVDLRSDDGKQYRRALMFAKANGHSGAVTVVESLYAEACNRAGERVLASLEDEMSFDWDA